MDNQLTRIADLIKNRQFAEARTELQKYLKQKPDDTYAWYLLSFAENNLEKQITALEKAAKLSPNNAKVNERLGKLRANTLRSGKKQTKSSRLPLVIAIIVVVIALASIAGIYLISSGNRPDQITPLPSPSSAAAVQATNTEDAVFTPTGTASPIPPTETAQPTETDTPTSQTLEAGLGGITTPENDIVRTRQAQVIQQIDVTELPDEEITVEAAEDEDIGDTGPTDGAVPLNETVDIGTGEMLIIQADRPGYDRIFELGGDAPEASTGEEWVLVEMLLICYEEDNCAPQASAIAASGISGTTYQPESSLNITPLFNEDAYFNGQIYGYVGFIVPTTERDLQLLLTQNGDTYRFALQEEGIEEE